MSPREPSLPQEHPQCDKGSMSSYVRRVSVLFVIALAVCAHAVTSHAADLPDTFAVRLTVGPLEAPLRVVTIDADGSFVDESGGGTHTVSRRTMTGRLRPGELNDILLTTAEAGFWEWQMDEAPQYQSRLSLEVRVAGKSQLRSETDPAIDSRLRALVDHILSFFQLD
jgi:hypothetical protein